MTERRPTTSKYPLRIYMRNAGTSLEITGDEGVLTVESRALLNAVPPNIETWGCKWRRMSDGRCFVVMRTFIPSSFIYDLFWGEGNSEPKSELAAYIAREVHRVQQERESEGCK